MTWDKEAFANENYPRPEDVGTFLVIYEHVTQSKKEDRDTLKKVFDCIDENSSTAFGKLTRILQYVDSPSPGETKNKRTPGLGAIARLFPRVDGAIQTTPLSEVLAEEFVWVLHGYDRARTRASRSVPEKVPVKVAASHVMGQRVMSRAFSRWQQVFGPNGIWTANGGRPIQLECSTGNSKSSLLPVLNRGGVDLVINYGPDRIWLPKGHNKVGYVPVPYAVRMVLLCHPEASLYSDREATRTVTDCQQYWASVYELWLKWSLQEPGRPPRPHYDQLTQLALEPSQRAIAPGDPCREILTRLLPTNNLVTLEMLKRSPDVVYISPSYYSPDRTPGIWEGMKKLHKVTELEWYEDCSSRVRMGQGSAVVTEVFSTLDGVVAYPFVPLPDAADLTRHVGLYFYLGRKMPIEVAAVASFFYGYFVRFENHIRLGNPPGYADKDYRDYCDAFAATADDFKSYFESEPNPMPAPNYLAGLKDRFHAIYLRGNPVRPRHE